jgi:hypothetical protein
MSAPEPAKKPRGCFFYGCITCLALSFLAAIGILLLAWFGVRTLNALVAEYTDTAPMTLPKADMPPDELAKLEARVADFGHALDARTNTPPLVLTVREINALMSEYTRLHDTNLHDKFYVDLEGDHIKGQVSLPLDQIKLPFVHTAGRYLNGTGDLAAGLTNATLSVSFTSFEATGKPLPLQIMATLQQVNFADKANQDPTNVTTLSHIDSIEFKDSTLIIKPKAN